MSNKRNLESVIINAIMKEDPNLEKDSIVKIEEIIKTVTLESSF